MSVRKHSNILSSFSASERGDRRRVVLTEGGGCGGGGGEENVGGLLINMAEDKGDVKPSNDMSRAGDSVAAQSNC